MVKNLERMNDDFYTFQKYLKHYANSVSDTVIIAVLEARIADMFVHQREVINQKR